MLFTFVTLLSQAFISIEWQLSICQGFYLHPCNQFWTLPSLPVVVCHCRNILEIMWIVSGIQLWSQESNCEVKIASILNRKRLFKGDLRRRYFQEFCTISGLALLAGIFILYILTNTSIELYFKCNKKIDWGGDRNMKLRTFCRSWCATNVKDTICFNLKKTCTKQYCFDIVITRALTLMMYIGGGAATKIPRAHSHSVLPWGCSCRKEEICNIEKKITTDFKCKVSFAGSQ